MDEVLAKKIDGFFTQFKHQHYKKSELLIRADDNPQGIFYLKNGSVKQYAISKNGDEMVVNIYKPISFFPMSWAINNIPNNYFFEALGDVEIWRAPREQTVAFVKNNPDVLFDLLSRVYRGTDGLSLRMTYLMSGSAYARLIAELLIYAKRFGRKGKDRVSLEVSISEKELANQAGMTRETVSRGMKNLKSKNLVALNNNLLIIRSIQKLEDELARIG